VQIIGVLADLVVDGVDTVQGAGHFSGRVIAIALDDDPDRRPPSPSATWLLVADDQKPAPLWVLQSDVSAQRLGR
jgi:hypothetical protein